MASIRKYRDKWRAEVRRQGHKPMSKVFTTRKTAERWALEQEIAIENGDFFQLSGKTVRHMISRYLDEHAETKQYHRTVLAFWEDQLGHLKLNHVRRAHVIEARKALQSVKTKEGELLAPSTINRRVALLSKLFRIAREEWDWCRDNPCHVRSLREDNQRDRLLTQEEAKRLQAALQSHPEPSLYPFVMVALYTGMRAGEIQRLRWQDVNLEDGHIQVLRSKNGEKRSIVVGGEALRLLKERRREVALRGGGYVFFNTHRGTAPYNYRAHWAEVKRTAGIEDFRFHDLRHAFTTQALKSGMNPVMVQLVTGHKSSHMLKRYSHLTKDVAAQVSTSVVESMEGLSGE